MLRILKLVKEDGSVNYLAIQDNRYIVGRVDTLQEINFSHKSVVDRNSACRNFKIYSSFCKTCYNETVEVPVKVKDEEELRELHPEYFL